LAATPQVQYMLKTQDLKSLSLLKKPSNQPRQHAIATQALRTDRVPVRGQR
jgi:hypothetical protein